MGNVNQAFEAKEKAYALRMRKKFHHKDDWWARCEGCDAKKILIVEFIKGKKIEKVFTNDHENTQLNSVRKDQLFSHCALLFIELVDFSFVAIPCLKKWTPTNIF